MAVSYDSKGRVQRHCKPRIKPMKVYRKTEFQARYRLSKKVVRLLVKKFKGHNSTQGLKNGGGLSHTNKFCLALRYFSTGGLYYLVGDSQGVSTALVSRAVKDVTQYFYRHAREYIHWPDSFMKQTKVAKDFYSHKRKGQPQKKPFVMGLVDGTHIPISRPKVNESCYVNRKNYHSINATMYCDFNRRITNVDPRWPGSVNDAYALHASKVGDMVKSGSLGNFILLGDGGYGLSENVFTPYKKPKTPKEKAFNSWHRTNRARVEQTIGILKQRFRCLDSSSGYLRHTPQMAAKVLVACCCLHNVAMDHGIKIMSHENDPWTPKRDRLEQPVQRSQRAEKEEIRKFRDDYVEAHF